MGKNETGGLNKHQLQDLVKTDHSGKPLIERGEIERLYNAAMEMKKYYSSDAARFEYYLPCFWKVQKAYDAGSLKDFRSAMVYLLDSIKWE